jgi:hypothetical protein
MKVIIAGSRTFDDYKKLEEVCDWAFSKQEEIEVVCGMAKGADLLGKRYAESRGHKVKEFPADWKVNGKAAGPIRNEEMAKYADALILFWDGSSKGSLHMATMAKKYNLKSKIYIYGKERYMQVRIFNG